MLDGAGSVRSQRHVLWVIAVAIGWLDVLPSRNRDDFRAALEMAEIDVDESEVAMMRLDRLQ